MVKDQEPWTGPNDGHPETLLHSPAAFKVPQPHLGQIFTVVAFEAGAALDEDEDEEAEALTGAGFGAACAPNAVMNNTVNNATKLSFFILCFSFLILAAS